LTLVSPSVLRSFVRGEILDWARGRAVARSGWGRPSSAPVWNVTFPFNLLEDLVDVAIEAR